MRTLIATIVVLLAAHFSVEAYSSSNLYASSTSAQSNYGSSSRQSNRGSAYNGNYYGSSGAYGSNLFADSSSTYYDGYQQAWRYLGWYVKCGYPSDRYNDDGSGSHEGSGDNQRWEGNNYCQRFLIWAAYIDENYQGGGIGEYQYYDPYSGNWDTTACDTHGNGRCAKMDCHETNSTNWKLMGVFKEASYFGNDAFFEQLFKHEGYCLWNDDDKYEFMSESREDRWTQGCVSTGITGDSYYFDDNSNGNYIYLDLKPTWNGNMTYGLYTDSACKREYEGLDIDVDTVSASMGLLYGSYLQQWNDALEVYKVCQPCRAYNLNNAYTNWQYYSSNKSFVYMAPDDDSSHSRDDETLAQDPNHGFFQCNDDAGYTNVNQCMKFRSHADLEVATWEDLVTATNQGGILEVNVGGTIFGSQRMSAQQYQYMLMNRRSELAQEAKIYAKEAQKVNAMEEEATMWEHRGNLLALLGGSLFIVAALRCLRNCCCSRKHDEEFTSPLLDIPIEQIHAAMLQQHEQELLRQHRERMLAGDY